MVFVLEGLQWGDEGKGRVVDYLAKDAEMVIRFQGGDNAGHTVINDKGKFALHIIPSGVFNDDNVKVLYNSKNQTKIGLRKTVVKVMDGNLIANESSREEIDVYIKGNKVNSFNGRISDKYIITNENPQSLMDLNGNLITTQMKKDGVWRIK